MAEAGPTFEFATPSRIVFGRGARSQIVSAVASLGSRTLLVTGRSDDRLPSLLEELAAGGIRTARFKVSTEPTVDSIRQGLRLASDFGAQVVLGVGGGSALDAAKAIGALATHPGDPLDYLDVIGAGRSLDRPGLPVIAVPTTAGTGAEVTRNAVLASTEHHLKVSLRSPWVLPRIAMVDPELTFGTPPDLTARCGFDALAQLVEPYLSVRANPITDALCQQGMRLANRSLRRACFGEDPQARVDLSLAATLSGMALANAGLGIVHGLASVVGGLFSAPHGAICGRLLAPALRVNLGALRQREPEGPALGRMGQVAQWLTDDSRPEAVAAWCGSLAEEVGLPRLAAYGLTAGLIPRVVEGSARASSTRANPIILTDDEISAILEESL